MYRVRYSVVRDGLPAIPLPLRKPITIVAILAALVFTVTAVRYGGEVAAGPLDTWAQVEVEGLLPEPGVLAIDFVGEPLGVVVFAGLLATTCLALGRWRLAVVTVVGLGGTGVVTTGLKPVVGRTIHGDFLAYPSGHTATATVFAFIVMLLLVDLLGSRRLPGVLLILTGAGAAGAGMALSQIALGAHYLTDTIGGFCAAMVVVPTTACLIDLFPKPRLGEPARSDEKSGFTQSKQGTRHS